MKRNFPIAILLILALFFSCRPKDVQTVEGDLFFRVIDFQSIFDYPDSIIGKIESNINTVSIDTLPKEEKKLYQFLKYLNDNELLRRPFIRLRLDNGAEKMLFLDTTDYRKFEHYNYSDLVRDKKKIRVKAQVTSLQFDTLSAFNSIKLISIVKLNGQTYWKK